MTTADRVKQTTIATDTSTLVLGGAVAGFTAFSSAFSTGATGIEVMVGPDINGAWLLGEYTFANGSLTRTKIVNSSAGVGADVTLAAGTKDVFCTVSAARLGNFARLDTALGVLDLPAVTTAPSTASIELTLADGTAQRILVANMPAGSGAADGAAPSQPGSFTSSGVTQTSATLAWAASTDNVGVSAYEISKDGGTTYTNVGNVLTYTYAGTLTANTTYAMRVRSIDAAGNKSAAASLSVTTAAANGDNTPPSMAGSISTSNVTDTALTMSYQAGSDNVAVSRYEVSVDTGTANWVNNGTNLSYTTPSTLAASTPYTLRVRCYDAAGNVSNVLTGTVTTGAAAPQTAYTITGYNGNAVRSSIDLSGMSANGSGKKYAVAGIGGAGQPGQFTVNQYFNITANSGGAAPASAKCGWGTSATVPPAEILITDNNGQNGVGSMQNGLVPMNHPGAFECVDYLWFNAGDNTPKYFWVKPVDGPAQCLTPAGVTITGA